MSSNKPRNEMISMLYGLKVNNLQSQHPVSAKCPRKIDPDSIWDSPLLSSCHEANPGKFNPYSSLLNMESGHVVESIEVWSSNLHAGKIV